MGHRLELPSDLSFSNNLNAFCIPTKEANYEGTTLISILNTSDTKYVTFPYRAILQISAGTNWIS
jgi:hypothetical protein